MLVFYLYLIKNLKLLLIISYFLLIVKNQKVELLKSDSNMKLLKTDRKVEF